MFHVEQLRETIPRVKNDLGQQEIWQRKMSMAPEHYHSPASGRRLWRSTATSNREIAAGVTPEILDA